MWSWKSKKIFPFKHSHKLFNLLQDIFTCARSHREPKNSSLPKSTICFLSYVKWNKIIAQNKTTNIKKQFYQWLILFISFKFFLYIGNTCKWQTVTVHTVDRNCVRVISCQQRNCRTADCNTSKKKDKIKELAYWRFPNTAQKIKCSIEELFSKFDQIWRKLWIWSHLLKMSFNGKYQFLFSET